MDNKNEIIKMVLDIDSMIPMLYSKYNRFKSEKFAITGLTAPQTAIIMLLGKHGSMRVSDIASCLSMVDSNVSGICTRLERMNYVKRRRLKENRREVQVELTDNSLAIIDDLDRMAFEFAERILEKVTLEEIQEIKNGLDKLCNLVETYPKSNGFHKNLL